MSDEERVLIEVHNILKVGFPVIIGVGEGGTLNVVRGAETSNEQLFNMLRGILTALVIDEAKRNGDPVPSSMVMQIGSTEYIEERISTERH